MTIAHLQIWTTKPNNKGMRKTPQEEIKYLVVMEYATDVSKAKAPYPEGMRLTSEVH